MRPARVPASVLLGIALLWSCTATPADPSADAGAVLDDAGGPVDAGGGQSAPDAGHAARPSDGSLRWSQALALCAVAGQGATIAASTRTKRRVFLPPRDYGDLRPGTLSTPLVDVLVETGVHAGEQVLAASAPSIDFEEDERSLSADVRHDFGPPGVLAASTRCAATPR